MLADASARWQLKVSAGRHIGRKPVACGPKLVWQRDAPDGGGDGGRAEGDRRGQHNGERDGIVCEQGLEPTRQDWPARGGICARADPVVAAVSGWVGRVGRARGVVKGPRHTPPRAVHLRPSTREKARTQLGQHIADPVVQVDGADEAGKDVVSEGREPLDVSRRLRECDDRHEGAHAQPRRCSKLVEVVAEAVGDVGQLACDCGNRPGGAQHEERLRAHQRVDYSCERVHREVLGEPDAVV
eukprot:scaffold25859_cov25-Tisochrysis_lutea.AAC.4